MIIINTASVCALSISLLSRVGFIASRLGLRGTLIGFGCGGGMTLIGLGGGGGGGCRGGRGGGGGTLNGFGCGCGECKKLLSAF